MALNWLRIPTFLLLNLLVLVHLAKAQPTVDKSPFSVTEYENHGKYYEQITYIGKRKDHFIVNTYLKDSTLYRIDNYRYIDQGNLIGALAVRHGPSKILYDDGRLYLTCDYNMNVLNGAFIVYYNNGAIKRRELYKNGTRKKSVCYDSDGAEQPCEPFYQQVKFMGNDRELTDYLTKNLAPVFDGTTVRIAMIKLVVNDIGQVIDVASDVGRDNPKVLAGIRRVVQEMPRWRENESNWKSAQMDSVPVSGVWVMQVYRDRSYIQVNIPHNVD
ncbi:toxin-antitoxin system YwqK family antitoxin [Fibrella arboris]|uniref:toxin-antitoxin system YwqK family antitoxin n=1 Tax=Fibrella arboris TaxID=3242486 RepID=UPI003520088B